MFTFGKISTRIYEKRNRENEITHTHTHTQNEIERERAILTVYETRGKENKEIERKQC